jgi:glycosyltransferase involved in cell wall biosynthesis
MVSKIARTIGRALNLNEDLIEAASLGHDLGHVPFGHEGEKILNEISLKYNEGFFSHNVQSVRTLMNIENKGLGNALKVAVENCSYELIARMDSDDVAVSDRFEQQLRYFADGSECDMVGGDVTEFIDSEDNLVGKRSVPTTHGEIIEYMKSRCAFNHPTVMFKKSVVLGVGGYIDWFWNEDYYLWIRMQLGGARFANTGTTLVNMRSGSDMYARRGGKRYYKSEKKLQKFMLDNKMIGRVTYSKNVLKRWIVQRLLPNRVRGWVFRKFARKKV